MKVVCKVFLLVIILLTCISYVTAPIVTEEEEGPGGVLTPGDYKPEDIVIQIEADLENLGSVDFSQEPYASNPELVLEALKEKYPNLDLNSIDGVKIDGNTLTTSDGSKIDLTTGKPITVETDGNKVTYFDDGSGTTIVNAVGMEYTAEVLKIESADSVEYYGSTSTMVQNYEAKIGTFTVASADAVIIGSNIFNKVKDSIFSVIANVLVYADVNSAKNNNTATIENPIQGSSENIKVDYNLDDNFEAMVLDSQINFNVDKGILLNLTKITFKAEQDRAELKITAGEPPKYSVSRGILNFIVEDFIEVIEAECVLSSAEIDFKVDFDLQYFHHV